MATVSKSAVSLRFIGDALDPDEISKCLGGVPTTARSKGLAFKTPSGLELIARTGSWSISAPSRRPGDLDGQISEILAPLTDDLTIWLKLAGRYRADLFCGLFLADANEGIALRPQTLSLVAARGLTIGFDIYMV